MSPKRSFWHELSTSIFPQLARKLKGRNSLYVFMEIVTLHPNLKQKEHIHGISVCH